MNVGSIGAQQAKFGQIQKKQQGQNVKFGLLDGGIVSGPCAIGCGAGCLALLAIPLLVIFSLKRLLGKVGGG